MPRRLLPATLVLLCTGLAVAGDGLPEGYWSAARSDAILNQTLTVRLAPDLSDLSAGEQQAVALLIEAGGHLQRIYEDSLHEEALEAAASLARLHAAGADPSATGRLLELYRLFQGPIATTPDNQRLPFLPVAPWAPTRNVYPAGLTAARLGEQVESGGAGAGELLDGRSVVRAATAANIDRDLGVLRENPVLHELHPGLDARLRSLRDGTAGRLYAIPQSVRWPAEILAASRLLARAATAVEADDAEFAGFLRNRSRDLLSDDYESGDAAWVTGRFHRLNAQIGSYETYDDPLFGAKAFMSLTILRRDEAASGRVSSSIVGLQAIEDSLPYQPHRRVRSDVPIGVYDVIADFGQSRSANTATILPNDPLLTRRYGRTILMRGNVIANADLFANSKAAWDAVVAPEFAGDLKPAGELSRTLWHEIGHYLGPDRDPLGRPLDEALGSMADAYEEMKSDLVSLYAVPALLRTGYYDEDGARAVYANGIRRVLQKVRPRRDQPYQTMQLMQFNWFLANGLLAFDRRTQRLSIDYDRYPDVVRGMLTQVLAIQQAGDQARAAAFMDEWTGWRDDLHEVTGRRMRDGAPYRWVLMRYGALGD